MKKTLIIFTTSLILSGWIAGHALDVTHEQIDAELKGLWKNMITRLIKKDIDGAVTYFTYRTRKRYKEQFSLIKDNLPLLFSEMRQIEAVYIKEDEAKYRTRIKDKDGEHTAYVWFSKDIWGQWKIEKF